MSISMRMIQSVREIGWPDKHGDWNYGNAAVLSFLSSVTTVDAFVKQHSKIPVRELIGNYA